MAAVSVGQDAFPGADRSRPVSPASPDLLALIRPPRRGAADVSIVGAASPGLVQFTSDVLFQDLWLRPGLAPRDRSLVTVSALSPRARSLSCLPCQHGRWTMASLGRETAEAVTHLAFYVGWPNVFSAIPIVKAVFESRPNN